MAFNRRNFLKGFLAAAGSVAGNRLQRAQAVPAELTLNRFYVAGFQYYDGPRFIGRLNAGQNLTLLAEPDNPHDRFAVKIVKRGIMLGYVPRTDNHHLSRLLGQGAKLTGRVIKAQPEGPTWRMLKIEVCLETTV